MRHLSGSQAISALRRGRQIDQLLGREQLPDGRWSVSWITIAPTSDGFRLTRHEVEDVGPQMATYDVAEFPAVDPEEEAGEGRTLQLVADPEEAIAVAARHGASSGSWVNFGVVGDEYRDLVE